MERGSARHTKIAGSVPIAPRTATPFTPSRMSGSGDSAFDQNKSLHLSTNDIIAASSVATVSVIGIASNIDSLYIIRKQKRFHNAFGVICTAFTTNNIFMLTLCAVYPVGAILSHDQFPMNFITEKIAGQITSCSYYAAVYTHLLEAINRFVAITYPLKYSSFFTIRRVLYIICSIWVFVFAITVPYYFYGCFYLFYVERYLWEFEVTPCGRFQLIYIDFAFCILSHVAMFGLDLTTAIKIRQMNKNKLRSGVVIGSMQKKRKQDIQFFIQGCISASVYVVCEISYTLVTAALSNKWAKFFFGMILWQTQHALDGVILVLFNRRPFSGRRNVATVTANGTSAKVMSQKTEKKSLIELWKQLIKLRFCSK